MISAGAGIFKVHHDDAHDDDRYSPGIVCIQVLPSFALITKQRMMDQGIGLDLVSLSQPPLHHVPLFLVDCGQSAHGDFYEVPHWVNVSFVDCSFDSG